MKSIKPGRGPSFMSGIGSVIAIVFGIFWTIMASSMGAPAFLPLFGFLFIIIGIVQAVFHFKNATTSNRFSIFDITDNEEEKDPLNSFFNSKEDRSTSGNTSNESEVGNFCPYCGFKKASDHLYCKQCGKKTS